MSNEEHEYSFSEVKITQIDPPTDLSELEKTALLQVKIEQEEENLLRQEKEILNKEKYRPTLSDTIRIKLSDIKKKLAEDKRKKSLYNTVILKLDEIIKKNNSLDMRKKYKVTNVQTNKNKKKTLFPSVIIGNDIKINVDTDDYGRYLYKLNKIALKNLTKQYNKKDKVRNSKYSRLVNVDNVHVSKKNYTTYQEKLNKFAINKLYYKFAPKESKKYKLYKACLSFSLIIFLFTSVVIVNWLKQGYSIKRLENDIIESTDIYKVEEGTLYNVEGADTSNYGSQYWKYLKTPLSAVDFTELLKENSDTVGWIIVNDTNINYPVVQTDNNDYYLNHAFDKTSNNAGWVYADFRDNFNIFSSNMVIYGHGRKDKIMFGSLTKSLDKNWYTKEENQIIQLSTLKYNTMWQIFSIYTVPAESYYISTDFDSNTEYAKFLGEMLNRSIYNFNVNLSTDDKILTLSTCYNDNGIRLVVQAKLVKLQERN